MRTLSKVALVTVLSCAVSVGARAAPVQALTPDEQGWWSVTNPDLSPVGLTSPVDTAPPDVPAEGLLVEGGASASSAIAYAALSYSLPPDSTATALTLSVATGSATTPDSKLEICPLEEPTFEPQQGGVMSNAPAYSCSDNVTAQPSSSGTSYSFSVARLVHDGTLAVAILPTSPTDRVVFSQPTSSSLSVRSSSPTSGTSSSATQSSVSDSSGPSVSTVAPTAITSGTSGSGSDTGMTGDAPAVGSPALDTPAATVPAQSPALSPTTSIGSAAPDAQSPVAVPGTLADGSPPAKPLAVIIVLVAALVAAIAWGGAGRAAIRAVENVNERRSFHQ